LDLGAQSDVRWPEFPLIEKTFAAGLAEKLEESADVD